MHTKYEHTLLPERVQITTNKMERISEVFAVVERGMVMRLIINHSRQEEEKREGSMHGNILHAHTYTLT